ncbi:MAG: Zn-ribbon domain-containing OB-fold protein [Roseiarcus sp.]
MATKDLSGLDVPGPTITALSAPFWKAAQEGRLVLQRCESCGRPVFYPRGHCPHCWGRELTWREASGRGRLKSHSTVHRPGHPGWLPIAPFTVGLIELEEGPTMLSFILEDGEGPPPVGAPMGLSPTQIGKRILPCFRKARTAQ